MILVILQQDGKKRPVACNKRMRCHPRKGPAMSKRFTISERVRWSDTDRAGIIYYGQFLRFFEVAEMELFREVGMPYGEVFERYQIWLPRVQIHFDFRAPLLLDDLISV